jgi:arylsulfatase A
MRRVLQGTALVFLAAAVTPSGPAPAVPVEAAAPPAAMPVVMPSADGAIVLSGSVATIRGTTLRWEPQEKKRTLGFWTKAEDAAEWTFAVEAAGDFDVEVLQGCGKGQGGSEMIVTLDPERAAPPTIRFVVEDTGGFQEFRARTIGRLTLAAGEHVIRVKPERIAKQAACDIRQIRLVPAGPR